MIKLDAKRYDLLKAEAEKHGGVGSGRMFDVDDEKEYILDRPHCAYGLGYTAGIVKVSNPRGGGSGDPAEDSLYTASDRRVLEFTFNESDDAVHRVDRSPTAKVPFDKWAEELRLVRVEESNA